MIGETKNALNATPLIQYLKPDELELLGKYINTVSFLPGHIILKPNSYSPGIYIIIDGGAIITTRTLGSDKTQIATLSKGDFIGEISVLTNTPVSNSVIASNSMRCLLISNIYLDFLSLFFPEIRYKILLAIAKQICCRLKNLSNDIMNSLAKSDMITQSMVSRKLTSLPTSRVITNDNEIDLDKLKNTAFFAEFNKEEYEILLKHAKLIKAEKYCTLIKETEKNAGCYIVIRGAIQSSIIHNEIVAKLSVIGPINLFCDINTIDPSVSSIINFTTCEQAILFEMKAANLELIQNNNKQLWSKLFTLICKSLLALEKSVQKLNIRLEIESYNR